MTERGLEDRGKNIWNQKGDAMGGKGGQDSFISSEGGVDPRVYLQ